MGFLQNLDKQYDIYKNPYETKKKPSQNLWDAENFTSVNNTLPIYPRRKGFVSFDSMTPRKPINISNAHESRFLSLNPFPSPLSSVKHTPMLYFDKQLPRDNKVLYEGIYMSDSLYKCEERDHIRPKLKGIFQFAQSTLGKDGTRIKDLPHNRSRSVGPSNHLQFLLNQENKVETPKLKIVDVLLSNRKQVKVVVDSTLPQTIRIDKKLPRVKSPNCDLPLIQNNKETVRLR